MGLAEDLAAIATGASKINTIVNGAAATTVPTDNGTRITLARAEQLAMAKVEAMGAFIPRGDWATGISYHSKDIVRNPSDGTRYAVITDHVAGVFQDDLDDGLLALYQDQDLSRTDAYSYIKGTHHLNVSPTITDHSAITGSNWDNYNLARLINIIGAAKGRIHAPCATIDLGGNTVTIPSNIQFDYEHGFSVVNGTLVVEGPSTPLIMDSYNDLISSSGVYHNESRTIRCFSAHADDGGGDFVWDSGSVETVVPGWCGQVSGVPTGRWKRAARNITPDMVGSVGHAFAAGADMVTLLAKTYTATEAVSGAPPFTTLRGSGFSRTVDDGVESVSGSVVDLATYGMSLSAPNDQAFGLSVSDAFFKYSGSGTGITVSGYIQSALRDLYLDLDGLGTDGILFSGNAFFSVLERATVAGFRGRGVVINNAGTKSVVRDSNIGSAQATASAAIEINVAGAEVHGGQADINRADNLGVGILFNNLGSAALYGGLVTGLLTEADTGVKVTGTTHAFSGIVVFATRHTLGSGQVACEFDRAFNCVLMHPALYGPTGGTVIKFGANAIQCGLIGNYDACRAGVSVHASAQNCWKRCTDRLAYTDRANITTNANLTVVVDDCQYVGRTLHNGTAWDKFYNALGDDSVVSFVPPKAVGRVTVQTTAGGGDYIQANYNVTSGAAVSLVVAGGSSVNTSDGVLTGSDGSDGYLTLRCSSSGSVYIENRRGSSRTLIVIFD